MNPEEVGQFLESKTYDYYLEQALSQVSDDIDKREGSIIYDALAPACYQLALFTFDLKNVLLNASSVSQPRMPMSRACLRTRVERRTSCLTRATDLVVSARTLFTTMWLTKSARARIR